MEVRAAGRFAYRKDPKKQADYRDHYTLAKARRARRARLAENAQNPV